MIVDVSSNFNLQNKKYDYIRIAFILSHLEGQTTANTINYYFNRIFPNKYCNSHRISQIIKQYPDLFIVSATDEGKVRQTRTYTFRGELKLNKTTKLNWSKKSKKYFTITP